MAWYESSDGSGADELKQASYLALMATKGESNQEEESKYELSNGSASSLDELTGVNFNYNIIF